MADLEANVTVVKELFYKNDFGIIRCNVDKILSGELKTDRDATVFKGKMPRCREGEGYKIAADYIDDKKFGGQYNVRFLTSAVALDDKDENSKRKYLESIFTKKQVEQMYKDISDPYLALKDGNAAELVKISGCGMYRASEWITRFQKEYRRALIYSELHDYNLSSAIIDKLLNTYNSPEMVIQKVKDDPYVLVTEVRGIGWATADNIAVAGGMSLDDPKRIKAYMYQYLDDKGEEGFSWITEDEFIGAVLEQFGNDLPDEKIIEAVQLLDPVLWRDKEEKRIGLSYFFNYENKIATELLRIRDAETSFDYSDWEKAVERIETLQGWKYTEEQRAAIKKGLENNILLIQGGAGVGKTTIVKAILECSKGHSFVQCAFSGKAASRLMEVTGQDGFTIHRLLGFPTGPEEKQRFAFNDENTLGYDIYIIDEISMVDMKLFYYLLRAIPSGSKVICLGDNGQLEAIGAGNIAFDLLATPEIESCTLNKIHRQAEDSAIVTESIKIRNKQQIIPEDWVGHEVRGKLQDLDLTCYSDNANTYYEIMKAFNIEWNKSDKSTRAIMNIQVLSPMKNRGASTYQLNNVIQEICNPKPARREFMTSQYGGYYLKVGDKVINTVNNYKTNPNIYNGNIGIIKRFEENYDEDTGKEHNYMVIDFDGIGEVKVLEDYWKNIELAYALTVHKYQGSQAEVIIFGFDFSAFSLLTKELVYTGITRAIKKCYLIAQNKALRYATTHSEVKNKQTHLQRCLHDQAHPVFIF